MEIENSAGVVSKTFTLDLKGNFSLIENQCSLLREKKLECHLKLRCCTCCFVAVVIRKKTILKGRPQKGLFPRST